MKKWVFPFLFLTSPLFAIEPLTSISFGGGVDYSRICSDIADERACDSLNMVGNREGSAQSRYGSHRLNDVAVSTNQFSSLFSATIATGTKQFNVWLGVSGDTIYYSTSDTFTRWFILYRGLLTPNQKFSFAVAQNSIYMTGNAQTDPIFRYNVAESSFGAAILSVASNTASFYPKYLLYANGYMLAANVRDVRVGLNANTTYYDDRIYYSYLLEPSSFSIHRFLNIGLGDSEYLSGMTSKRGSQIGTTIVEAYKQSQIYSISFRILDPVGEGGDQNITKIAEGFGHISDYPPENIGAWDFLFSKDGIVQWDGGLLFRNSLESEKLLISRRIKNITDKLVARNSYKNSILKYYPKNNWLIFAYEDPDLFPRGSPNFVMIYDFLTTEWWPQRYSFAVGSVEVDKSVNGRGLLHFGDGMDGYIHVVDDSIDSDDSKKEIALDAMENTKGWANAGISTNVVVVGTASLSLTLTPSINTSSIAKVFVMPMGEWYDKSSSSNTDLLSFKLFLSSKPYFSRLRVDLQVEDVQNQFNANFSSVVISSNSLTGGSSEWIMIEIALSSFPISSDWTDLATENLPFARNLTRFGLRFVATATADLTLYFDDVRFAQKSKSPIDPFRITKQFNLGVLNNKDFQQIILNREKPRNSGYSIDVFTGLGEFANTVDIPSERRKEIYVCGFANSTGISKLSSVDFALIETTVTPDSFFENGISDDDFIYSYDSKNDRMTKIDLDPFGVFSATFGQLGSGTSNYNYVQETGVDSKKDEDGGHLLVMDHMNHRIKEETKKDFTFIRQHGQLGLGSTSFYNPTGVDFDGRYVYAGDDGNQRLLKLLLDDFSIEKEVNLGINTIGNLSVRCDDRYCYNAYNKGSNDQVFLTDIILEKRNKGDLSLLNRVAILPKDSTVSSSYTLRGSIALDSRYVYVSFNDFQLNTGNFYLQKLLQSDFSLVLERKSTLSNYGIVGDGLAREPKQKIEKISLEVLPNPHAQLKIYQKGELDSFLKLNSMAFVAEKLSYTK